MKERDFMKVRVAGLFCQIIGLLLICIYASWETAIGVSFCALAVIFECFYLFEIRVKE